MRTSRAGAIALVVLVFAGCSGAATPAATSSDERIPITVESQPSMACMQALITGILVPHAEWGMALQTPGTGELMHPIFPFGYSAVRDGDRLALLDAEGRLVARTGQLVQSSGGSIGGEGNPLVALCAGTIQVVPG